MLFSTLLAYPLSVFEISMKVVPIILLLTSGLSVLSCQRAQNTPPPPTPPTEAPSPAPPVDTAVPEPGETSTETFEGTLGVSLKPFRDQRPAVLNEIRSARHEGFDRVVLEFAENEAPGYRIEYAQGSVRSCGSGEVVSLDGKGVLVIQVSPAQAHNESGQSTISARERELKLSVMKDMKLICDFEADIQLALGVSRRNPYRVLQLSNPGRLVVDIKQ